MLLLHPRTSEVSLRNQRALPVSSTSQLQGYLDFSPCAHQGLLHFTALLSASQFHGSLDTHVSATVSPQVRAFSEGKAHSYIPGVCDIHAKSKKVGTLAGHVTRVRSQPLVGYHRRVMSSKLAWASQ